MATVLNDSSLHVFEQMRLAAEAAAAVAQPVQCRLWFDKLGFYVEARTWVHDQGQTPSAITSVRHFPWFEIMLQRHNKLLDAVEVTSAEVRRQIVASPADPL